MERALISGSWKLEIFIHHASFVNNVSVYNIWNRGIQWCVSILAVAMDLLITASIIFSNLLATYKSKIPTTRHFVHAKANQNMSPPSLAQIARWENVVNEILGRNLDLIYAFFNLAWLLMGRVAWQKECLIRSSLGDQYDAYMEWFAGISKPKLMQFLEEVSLAVFTQTLSAVECGSWESIYEFRRFLNRPHIMLIVIENHNGT